LDQNICTVHPFVLEAYGQPRKKNSLYKIRILSSDAKFHAGLNRTDIQDLRSVALQSYSPLSDDETERIGFLRAAGRSIGAIALGLGRQRAWQIRRMHGNCAVPGEGVTPARFCEAMSCVTAAVHIATTGGPAGFAGITATAVASITVEPPMLLFCINKTSPSAARMLENRVFCINTLASSHEALANIFAGRTDHHLDERFKFGEWIKLVTGAPVLKSAAAVFDCRLIEAMEIMTHFVMIGTVEAVEFDGEGSSLTYAHRTYGNI